ncbi:MAG TPA: FliA/WhiG family RNA polymerase sigma factor [Gemmatimonadaceae bacterium]|nr:FliA/WhiG family RNA polymerase sigma factor [Gemmatimonadaceae bacterium]
MAPAVATSRQSVANQGVTAEARQQILGEHLGLVYHVARQLCRAKQMDVELDELVSAGTIGLIEAFNNFDTSRGLAFSTFAAPRIRGAMLDELRRQDHVPRSVRRRTRELNSATEQLTRELGQAPDQHQIASRMGIDLTTLFRWQSEGDNSRFIPLERTVAGAPSGSRIPFEHLIASTGGEMDDRITHAQEVARLRDALLALSEQERNVLTLYYFEELKLHEIAVLLGVSESRVSQIRAKAITRLRKRLASLREPAA